jgi:multiple sugar transport system ATP-binding protein
LKCENGLVLKPSPDNAEMIRVAGIAGVLIGIRPESFEVRPSHTLDYGEFNVTVEVVEQMGNELYVYFSICNSTLTARLPADTRVEEGKSMALYVDMAKCHMFDAKTEKNLLLYI